MSAYDLWKTTPPPCLPEDGDCLHCGGATEWISGRQLIARKTQATPKPDRRRLWSILKKRICPEQCVCAGCEKDAIRVRLSLCECGATTAWECVCP
jgi:hypothetical protein